MRSRVLPLIVLASMLFVQACFGLGDTQPAYVAPALPSKVQVTGEAAATTSVVSRHVRTPKMKWSFDAVKNDLDSLMVGPDGTIYASSLSKVLAVSSEGAQKWSFDPGNERDRVSALVVGGDGDIYVGNLGGKVLALSPKGVQKWSFDAGKPVFSLAVASDGAIYAEAGVLAGKVLALSPEGAEKWSFDCGDCTSSALAIGRGGALYAVAEHGSDTGKVVALNAEGAEQWSFDAGSSVRRLAVGSNGAIYIGTADAANNGKVIALSPAGAEKWSFDAGKVSTLVVGRDGIVYAGTVDEINSETNDDGYSGKVFALSPAGAKKWSFDAGSWGVSALAVGRGRVVYAATNRGLFGKVVALSPP